MKNRFRPLSPINADQLDMLRYVIARGGVTKHDMRKSPRGFTYGHTTLRALERRGLVRYDGAGRITPTTTGMLEAAKGGVEQCQE